jgi:hypothetical protein
LQTRGHPTKKERSVRIGFDAPLAKNGLAYMTNGIVLQAGNSPAARSLAEMLKDRDLSAVDNEFMRAAASVEADPAAALTAACTLLEALFKTYYIQEEGLELPDTETIKDLWKPVRDHLGFDPASVAHDDMKRILGGLASAVDGVGSFRTHAGSAHGRGPNARSVLPHEARLAINAAHTLERSSSLNRGRISEARTPVTERGGISCPTVRARAADIVSIAAGRVPYAATSPMKSGKPPGHRDRRRDVLQWIHRLEDAVNRGATDVTRQSEPEQARRESLAISGLRRPRIR